MEEDISYILGEIENYNRDNAYLLDIEELFGALEHLLKVYKELEYKYNRALSDLVQESHKNKELKEEKKEWKEKWDKDTHKLQNALDLANADKINNYIQVSLVEEKIEEIDNMIIEISKGNLQKYTVGEIFLAKKILQE